ncbi:hypothetical protein K435DRAFT_780257, partial [Dendrothele bispora CBS 962.96]
TRPAKRKEPPSDDATVSTGCRTLPQLPERREKKARLTSSNSSRGTLFEKHKSGDDRERAGPSSTTKNRVQEDNMFYDATLPDNNAYVISVQNVLFRVNRELVRSFSPKLTKDLDAKMTANTSHGKKNGDANPLVLDDSLPDEWQAMLWALSVDSSERTAHIETPDQLCRMISLAIIANRYESVFEKDAMAAIYETCLPEHADLPSPVPSSILNRCTSFDFGYLMELCKRCLSLDDSDFSAWNPLIPRTVSNKGKSKRKAIAVNASDTSSTSSKYPPFYRNLPTMVLRHWIAELMPEARAWAIPLPLPKPKPQLSSESTSSPSSSQPVLPRASNVILPYNSMKDLHSPNTVLTVNSIITADELDLYELSGAAMYAYLREKEINFRLITESAIGHGTFTQSSMTDGVGSGSGSGSDSGSHHPTPPELEPESDSAFFSDLILPSATTLNFDPVLDMVQRLKLMKGSWEAGKLVPPETRTKTTKSDGNEKPRRSFKAPSEDDDDMDWESDIDGRNDDHDYDYDHEGRGAAAAPPAPLAASIPTRDETGSVSGMIPGAFPSTATGSTKETPTKEEEVYRFGTNAKRPFDFSVPTGLKMSGDGDGGVNDVEVKVKTNSKDKDKGKGKEREKEGQKPRSKDYKGKKKAAVELEEAQIASGGGRIRQRRPLLKRDSLSKIPARSSGHSSSSHSHHPRPHPPGKNVESAVTPAAASRTKRPHDSCISHQGQCIPIWERAFASYASSNRMKAVPQGDVLVVLALMLKLLERDGEERLIDMDEGCRWGAVERLKEVREQVWLGCLGGLGGGDGYFVL